MKGEASAAVGGAHRRLILAELRSYIDRNGYPPSIRELAAETGFAASVVWRHLHRLAADGEVEFGPSRSAMQIRVV